MGVSLLERMLDTKIAPMIYIMMMVSVIIGFCFMTGIGLSGGSESVLYTTGVLLNKQAWGAVLFVTATTAEFGMIFNKKSLIQLGGIAGFMAWMFASIALALSAHWYILLTVGGFHLIFHAYVYLATTTGYIFRESIYRG